MTVQYSLDDRALGARLLGYWRDCVADESDALAAAERVAAAPELEFEAVAAGRVPLSLAETLCAHEASAQVPVLVAVGRLTRKRRGGAAEGTAAYVPLWIPALLTRAGELHPDERRQPFLTRALLEPTVAAVSIGWLDDAADCCARSRAPFGAWNESWAWAMALWQAVVKEPFPHDAPPAWHVEPVARVVACERDGSSRKLLAVLDGACERLARACGSPLAERFVAGSAGADDTPAAQHGHLGGEPLSEDQRFALRRALALGEGDSLAIAGPPGTGASRVVRSLVASLIVDSVARAARPLDAVPPLIVLAVPGSESATRWLEALSGENEADPSARRWVAEAGGYAVGLSVGERETSTADRGYPTLDGGPAALQDAALGPALRAERERSYLESFARAYGRAVASLDDALDQLHAMTREWTARLGADSCAPASDARPLLSDMERGTARARVAAPLDAVVSAAAQALDALDEAHARASREAAETLARLEAASAALEPQGWYESAFSWLGNVARLRRQRFNAALGAAPPAGRTSCSALRAWVAECRASERARALRALSDRAAAAEQLARAEAERAAALRAFDETAARDEAPPERDESHEAAPGSTAAPEPSEALFDRVHRSEAFHAAARFWEGRRLRELAQPSAAPDFSGSAEGAVRRLRSIAMLHPVAVATLPALAAWYGGDAENEPLYAAMDQLIVVEAEQVDVARGAAVLPLAKRLVALGDACGREPIVQLAEARSRANLRERCGDLAPWSRLQERGLLSYDRSGAGLLQAVNARVTLTTQHARAPEIVACCAELAYDGLRAVRETPPRASLPALGYAHVRGRSAPRGASRVNESEARAVVQFLIERRELLLRAYPEAKCLADVVAILTPFRAQAAFIAERLADALRACRLRAEPDLAIGTPFQLRAAMPVVLYSHVLEPGAPSPFAEAQPNLLALALGGAGDHFLFFGDVCELARRPPEAPSGVLGKHLLASAANRLEGLPTSFYGPDAELAAVHTPQDHLALLDEALAGATERVLIVSPLAGATHSCEATLQVLAALARRGVGVTVFSDRVAGEGEASLTAALRADGIEWRVRDRILASALAIDRSLLYEGSFVWLGARGQADAQRAADGWLVRGPGAAGAIDELRRYYEGA